MTERPKTLLEFSNAASEPLPLNRSVVVIIDAQEEYRSGRLPLSDIGTALTNVSSLLARARQEGAPIIHIKQIGRAGGLFDAGGPTGAIMPEAAPAPGEAIIHKPLPNAFAQTDLDKQLTALGMDQVVFAGFMTHMCVSASARAALDLGYRSVVVSDAVATRDLPHPTDHNAVVKAADVNSATLAALADRFAAILPLHELA